MANSQSQGSILDTLSTILEIQELDMQMIQLMKLKKERQKELDNLNSVKTGLTAEATTKEAEILELKTTTRMGEGDLKDLQEKIKKLDEQQSSIKKVDEFNALSKEMAEVDRERHAREHALSDLYDRLAIEEELLKKINESLETSNESGKVLEREIFDRIKTINQEGHSLLAKRQELVKGADKEVFKVYERLLQNKRDRVIVPIENRCCSGCHIALTAQDENLVRKAERLIFCEHCSRILYWMQSDELEGTAAAPTRQRRRRSQPTA